MVGNNETGVIDSDHDLSDVHSSTTVHEMISARAEKSADKIAVSCVDQSLTYHELDTRSNMLAHRLRGMGVGSGELVGLCIERSLDMLVGLLGVLKAGGAYIPLDPAYPAERIAYMLADSNAKFVLTQDTLVDTLPQHQAQSLCLDGDWSSIEHEPQTAPELDYAPDSLAYVIYTSGSTGRPKGVEIPHRALVNFLNSMAETPGLNSNDHLLAVTTLSFDIAGLELYLPLVVGASLTLASRTAAADGNLLARLIEEQNVTVMQATPATWRLLLEAGWKGKKELRIFCGGETLTRELAERLLPCCRVLWNLYGPTETTIWSTVSQVESGTGPVSIGHPIANTEIQILDDDKQPVATGTAGELYIGGDGLARGYFNREELTTERFIPHPFQSEADARLYRTGDLAKTLPDGSLEHLGRVDFQVKVRGFRIELGEIEAGLDTQSSVRQSVVLAREDIPGEKRLVAYVLPNESDPPVAKDLRAALAARLPDYMVPGLFVFLDELPLTPNGKVDRNALPAPEPQRPVLSEEYVAPSTEGETLLVEIWQEVLRVEQVGINDNFFELGGDSLKVAQVATRIREALGVDILLRSLFENPTVGEFLPIVEAVKTSAGDTTELPISEVTRGEHIPLSFSQERVWFLHQLNPRNLAYNFASSLALDGRLDIAALEQALGEILRRHESYRTSFPTVDGRPVQIVHPAELYSLTVVDLTDKNEAERQAAFDDWCAEEFEFRFDLAQIPLVRWTLLRMTEEKSVLMHMEHHLVHDGWSFNIFLRELVDLYCAYSEKQASPLPELPVQFAEFATWQHEWMQGAVSDRQLEYWRKALETSPPVLDLPTKGPRPATQTFRGASLRPEVPVALCRELRSLSRDENSTLFMTMLAGFIALLHRYTGENDVAVGTFFANRRSRESEGLIGMILNNVVIRAALEANPSVRDLMTQVRDLVLESANYQDVPFDRVVEAVQPKRDLSLNPLFQVMFSFHDEPMPESGPPGLGVKVTPVLSNGSAKFDLGVIGIPHSSQTLGLPQGSEEDGLTMIWEHNTDLFETDTIARMFDHYVSVLRAMVENPEQRISNLRLDTVVEHQKLIPGWNETESNTVLDVRVHQMVAAQAASSPDAVAVVFESTKLTYAELERRTTQLANYLSRQGVGPSQLVGICLERSERMLVALLATLKAGGTYVPIDPTFPIDRQTFMLEDADISILVTETDLCEHLPVTGKTLIYLDSDAEAIENEPTRLMNEPALTPESLAYVIYTSGSTGKPKGVQIPHRALSNFLCSMRERPGLSATDKLLAVTTLSFDIAGLELYLPLVVGATVVVCPRAVAVNGEELASLMKSSGATVMQATPTTWQMLLDTGWKGDGNFTALCGGEALPRVLADELSGRVKSLWNMYGPTETTIWSTVHKIEAGATVPIGRPINNTQVHLLDPHGNIVPFGAVGELCIGGAGVAHGYLHRPDLTSEKFTRAPAGIDVSSNLYHTGDLARYLSDGTLECLGRTDHQIKLRGFRIELGEIESLLDAQEGISQSVTIAREDVPGDVRLVAYAVPLDGVELASADVLEALGEKLPQYMVPSVCMVLDEMPLTLNGKIDRRALPEPVGVRLDDSATLVEPRNETERVLKEIWEEVIGVSPLGVHDDFFDVGGHSLLAVRLVSAITKKTGKRISLAALWQGRTIENVARMLGADDTAKAESGFVELQTTGVNPPFFAVGSHPKYPVIANQPGADQPFYQLDLYGLQSQRIGQKLKPLKTIEEAADHYMEDLRRVQPHGPYYLGGGCEGAYVAFEMALQLQRQGEEVACLVMWIPPPLRESNGFILKRSAPYMVARQLRYLITGGALRNSSTQALKVLVKHEYIEYLILRALSNYSPRGSFEGRVTIVRTEHSPILTSSDLNKPWADRSTGGAQVHVVPGTHETWFEDHLENFTKVLRDSLTEPGRTQDTTRLAS